jgi:hypothetical protein
VLTSGTLEGLTKVLAAPPSNIPKATLRSLARSKRLTFDVTAFKPRPDGTATVPATLVDESGTTTRWLVTLFNDDGRWLVLTTQGAGATS